MAQFTKYTGTVTGQVSSLITALDAILVTGEGWTKPYTGVNKAAYLQAAGNGFYLRVDDSGPGAGGAKEARILGYETMSDVDTGTGLFPTAAQMAAGGFLRKSATADGTARNYKAWADDRTFIFCCESDTAGNWFSIYFGDIYSDIPSDGYRTMLVPRGVENSALTTSERLTNLAASTADTDPNNYIARSYLGTGTAVALYKLGDRSLTASDAAGRVFSGNLAYPQADGSLRMSPIRLYDPTTGAVITGRGILRGVWVPLHAIASFSDGDTFSGTGDLAGRTFEMVKNVYNNAGTAGVMVIETSNSLPTN